MKYLFIILLVFGGFLHSEIIAQSVVVTGVVTCANDEQPLPGVNIFTGSHFLGTITNSEGRFSITLPSRHRGTYLYFSSIGYKTDSIRLNQSNINVSLKLAPDVYALSSLVVMPDDALRRLLRDAFNRIPENYPAQPVRYEVFYRETSRDSTGGIIAVAEAILDIVKNSYTRPRDPGQVRVVKSRKNSLPQYDSIVHAIGFIGGAHSLIRGDNVLTRHNMINPNSFNRYNYQLTGMTRFEGRDVYIVNFSSRTSTANGRLYIDVEDLAYVKIVWSNPSRSRDRFGFRENVHNESQYIHFQGKWHLHHKIYSDVKRISSTASFISQYTEHIVLKIDADSINPISYEERLSFNEPFLQFAQQYDPEFWTGYNVLEQDAAQRQMLETFFATKDVEIALSTVANINKIADDRPPLIRIASNIYVNLGITYRSFSSVGGMYSFDLAEQNINFGKSQTAQHSDFGLSSSLGYRINKRTNAYFTMHSLFSFNSDLHNDTYLIGVEYRKNIKPRGHPLFIGVNFDFCWGKHYVDLGDFNNTFGIFRAGGKEFDAGKLNIQSGVQQVSLMPGMNISKRVSNNFELSVYAKYDFVLSSRSFVTIREKEGFFLSRKKANLSSDHFTVTNSDGVEINDFMKLAPFQLGIVMRYR